MQKSQNRKYPPMRCEEIQNLITQYSPDQLPDEVNEHLTHCPWCQTYAHLHYFDKYPGYVNLFTPIDLKENILQAIKRNKRKNRIIQVTSMAASVLLGLIIGLLMQYFFFTSTTELTEKNYQFTDVLIMDSFNVNTDNNE